MKRSKKEVEPNWHPNFRIPETLPDIKPIRTGFLINAIAAIICVVLIYVFAQRELRIMSLQSDLTEAQTYVQSNAAKNEAFLRLSNAFTTDAEKVEELTRFYDGPTTAYEFLLVLSEIRPKGLIYENVSFQKIETMERRNRVMNYRIIIRGNTRELAVLDFYKEAIRAVDFVREYSGEVNESIFQRDARTGIFPYEIQIDLTPPSPDRR